MEGERGTKRIQELLRKLPFDYGDVRLRAFEVEDAERHSAAESDPLTRRWSYSEPGDNSAKAVEQAIAEKFLEDAEQGHAVRMVIADAATDRYLGHMAFFDDRDSSVEIGFVLSPDARGGGLAQRALAATEELAKLTGYGALRARTDVENKAAMRVLSAAGYEFAGERSRPISQSLPGVWLQPFVRDLEKDARTLTRLQEYVQSGAKEEGIPGAQVTIIHRGVEYSAAAGMLNVRTGLQVTPDSIFQIGSITKLFTTVLVLQLVDDGLIDLNDKVVDHVPEFQLEDPEGTDAVRIIDLLQHRGGFDGDLFTDGGRGTDAPQTLIADLQHSAMFFNPGEQFAYSNAGMVVLGRLVELKRGTDYLSAVRERIYEPLGLERAVTLPEEAILYGAAAGHTRDEAGNPVVMPSWQLPMSAAATGAALTMSAKNLAQFGQMLLQGGRDAEGKVILSEKLVNLIGEESFPLPVESPAGNGFGVGAFTFTYEGAEAFGHDGQTVGQVAGLRIFPKEDLVVAVVTNRENTTSFTQGVIDYALRNFADGQVTGMPRLPEPALPIEAKEIEGFYANRTITADVRVSEGKASLRLGSPSVELGNQPAMNLYRVGPHVYRVTAEENGVDLTFKFTDTDGDGVADFLWFNRLLRRSGRDA